MECPQCHHVMEPYAHTCPHCTRQRPGDAFLGVNAGFWPRLKPMLLIFWGMLAFGLVGIALGLIGKTWDVTAGRTYPWSHHDRLVFVIGGLCAASIGAYYGFSVYAWHRRATAVMNSTRPLPALLSTQVRVNPFDPESRYNRILATLQPANPQHAAFRPIINMPVYLGERSLQFIRELPAEYTNVPAELYLPATPDDPVVFCVDGKCWCSRRGFRLRRT